MRARTVWLVVGMGVLLGKGIDSAIPPAALAAQKLAGGAPDCPWPRLLSVARDGRHFAELSREFAAGIVPLEQDAALGIARFRADGRSFWINGRGEHLDGRALLAYLLAEHRWMEAANPAEHVRPGDVVLDCGAHVGVFTYTALRRGAAKVVAIEPDPIKLECLRRNFAPEIAAGNVVLYPKGVWSSETTLDLSLAKGNSGEDSVVLGGGAASIEIAVTCLDRIVADLRLPRVDFIKMDIEGAEREALKGAAATLAAWRPRLMLDSYHLPDDMSVLPRIIRAARPDYRMSCGPCELKDKLTPHVTYYY
jgi:FkbM family methyltransferase